MIDTQKIVYERAMSVNSSTDGKKKVLLVQGGPGMGSFIAVNLLAKITNAGKMAQYVTILLHLGLPNLKHLRKPKSRTCSK